MPRAASDTEKPDAGQGAATTNQTAARILVVDDDPRVREITAEMLRGLGYGVSEAEGGPAALEALCRGEAYDLLVIDMAMPGLNGIETVNEARQRWPGLRALYITGYVDAVGEEAQTSGDPFVKKPFKLVDLKNGVHKALNRALDDARANVVPLRKARPERSRERG